MTKLLVASSVDGAAIFTVRPTRAWFIQKTFKDCFCNLLKEQYRTRQFIEAKIAELEIDPPKMYV